MTVVTHLGFVSFGWLKIRGTFSFCFWCSLTPSLLSVKKKCLTFSRLSSFCRKELTFAEISTAVNSSRGTVPILRGATLDFPISSVPFTLSSWCVSLIYVHCLYTKCWHQSNDEAAHSWNLQSPLVCNIYQWRFFQLAETLHNSLRIRFPGRMIGASPKGSYIDITLDTTPLLVSACLSWKVIQKWNESDSIQVPSPEVECLVKDSTLSHPSLYLQLELLASPFWSWTRVCAGEDIRAHTSPLFSKWDW